MLPLQKGLVSILTDGHFRFTLWKQTLILIHRIASPNVRSNRRYAIEFPFVLPRAAFQNKLLAKAMKLGITPPSLCFQRYTREGKKLLPAKFIKL